MCLCRVQQVCLSSSSLRSADFQFASKIYFTQVRQRLLSWLSRRLRQSEVCTVCQFKQSQTSGRQRGTSRRTDYNWRRPIGNINAATGLGRLFARSLICCHSNRSNLIGQPERIRSTNTNTWRVCSLGLADSNWHTGSQLETREKTDWHKLKNSQPRSIKSEIHPLSSSHVVCIF